MPTRSPGLRREKRGKHAASWAESSSPYELVNERSEAENGDNRTDGLRKAHSRLFFDKRPMMERPCAHFVAAQAVEC